MLRLFTGIGLPAALRKKVHLLHGGIPGARWTHPEDYHITLSFIGSVDEATAEEVDDALSRIRQPRFELALKGTGFFARGETPGYLWLGVEQSDALHLLKEKIDHALESRRIPFEKRKYTPHLTLARLKHADEPKLAEFMREHNLFSAPPFVVDNFSLYISHQANEAPLYEAAAEYPLG